MDLLLTNEALAQRTERSGNTAVVNVHAHMHKLICVFEELYFDCIFLAFEVNLVGLYVAQLSDKLRTGLRTPPLNLGIQNGPPLFSSLHGVETGVGLLATDH
jgi:hypothetical protein